MKHSDVDWVAAGHKAWSTRRRNQEQLRLKRRKSALKAWRTIRAKKVS